MQAKKIKERGRKFDLKVLKREKRDLKMVLKHSFTVKGINYSPEKKKPLNHMNTLGLELFSDSSF